MTTIRTILHPTDFSESSTAAAKQASALARQLEAELHLLFVLEDSMGKIPEAGLGFPAPGERLAAEPSIRPSLEENVGIRSADAYQVFLATRMGSVSKQIVSYANDNLIDMIVIGTHGRRGLSHALMGSVAEAVVRQASCPVLTVRGTKAE